MCTIITCAMQMTDMNLKQAVKQAAVNEIKLWL